jgi:acyl-CoA thioesterase-1
MFLESIADFKKFKALNFYGAYCGIQNPNVKKLFFLNIIVLWLFTLCSCSNPSDLPNRTMEPTQQTEISSPLAPNANLVTPSITATHSTLLVVGDSLSAAYGIPPSEGWVSLLAQRLQDKGYQYRIVNASISGDTTSGGRNRFVKTLQQYQPQIVILELGANDGLRALSLQKMRANLASMIKQSQQAAANVLLLGMRIPPNYGKAYSESFHQIYHDLATEYEIPLIPFFLDKVAENRLLIQEDGLHPTAAAQGQLLENVWEKLIEMLSIPTEVTAD